MNKITLNFPFVINDTPITEISIDFEQFKTGDYLAAISRRKSEADKPVNFFNDYALHFALGVGIILASNKGKGWAPEDFDRLKGSDIWQVTQLGIVFFAVKPGDQLEDSSAGQSGSTPNDSTPPAQNS